MTGKNKTPSVGWHPSPDLWPWLKARIERTAARRGGDGRGAQSEVLNEAVRTLKDRDENGEDPE